MSESWQDDAACNDHETPDLWHPKTGNGAALEAKAICRTCTVQQECGAVALADRSLTGVWGGMTDADRAALRRSKRPAAR